MGRAEFDGPVRIDGGGVGGEFVPGKRQLGAQVVFADGEEYGADSLAFGTQEVNGAVEPVLVPLGGDLGEVLADVGLVFLSVETNR